MTHEADFDPRSLPKDNGPAASLYLRQMQGRGAPSLCRVSAAPILAPAPCAIVPAGGPPARNPAVHQKGVVHVDAHGWAISVPKLKQQLRLRPQPERKTGWGI